MNPNTLYILKYAFIVLMLFCSGCAGITIPLDYNSSVIQQQIPFEFVDSRPAIDKQFKNATKEYPAVIYGDTDFVPSRMEVLKAELLEKAGDKLKNKKIEIISFKFVAYLPEWYSRIDKGSWFGPLGIVVASAINNSDNTNKFICSIEGQIDGKRIEATGSERINGFIDLEPARKTGGELIKKTIRDFSNKIDLELK